VLGTSLAGLPRSAGAPGPQPAPGLLPAHYAPRTPLLLIVGPPGAARPRLQHELFSARARGLRVGVLLLDDDRDLLPLDAGVQAQVVGRWADPAASAACLFDALRALDRAGLDLLLVRELAEPRVGLGRALADRLRRAAQQIIDVRMPQ
jgi:L-threonylcarbamoyladenylate synthase